MGPTQTFLKPFGILKSIFRLFLKIFILFSYKKVCLPRLPTDPKNFGHVTGNKAYFSFGLTKLLPSVFILFFVYYESMRAYMTQVDVDRMLLNVEPNLCYLGDMLCAGGGCKLAIITRCMVLPGESLKKTSSCADKPDIKACVTQDQWGTLQRLVVFCPITWK